jgi:XRE family aerobic/anaerobic benzoate catabolism transcriptional regulator
MSRRVLAEAAGLSDRYLTYLESGQGNVTILVSRRLAHALNVPVEHLLADETPPRS